MLCNYCLLSLMSSRVMMVDYSCCFRNLRGCLLCWMWTSSTGLCLQPKLGRVLTPLWGKTTLLSKKRRLHWRCASLFHQLLCHQEKMLLPWVVLVWQTLYRKELLAKQDLYSRYYWSRLLIKISSFTGWKSFLKSLSVHGHIYCSHHRVLGHIYVVYQWNCYPPITTCSSMVFVLEHWWNNGCHQQHFIVCKTSLAKFIIFYTVSQKNKTLNSCP